MRLNLSMNLWSAIRTDLRQTSSEIIKARYGASPKKTVSTLSSLFLTERWGTAGSIQRRSSRGLNGMTSSLLITENGQKKRELLVIPRIACVFGRILANLKRHNFKNRTYCRFERSPFPLIPPVFDMLIYRKIYMRAGMIYIFLPRVYIKNKGNGNAFREQRRMIYAICY